MTYFDRIVTACVTAVEESEYRDNAAISECVSQAIMKLSGSGEREFKIFVAKNYVQVHVDRRFSFLGVVDSNEFGFHWHEKEL